MNNTTYKGKYVEIKSWARKDHDRPFNARNMYRVCRETEKAVLLNPVDTWHDDFTFWCPKSAVISVMTHDEQGKTIISYLNNK